MSPTDNPKQSYPSHSLVGSGDIQRRREHLQGLDGPDVDHLRVAQHAALHVLPLLDGAGVHVAARRQAPVSTNLVLGGTGRQPVDVLNPKKTAAQTQPC